SRHLDMIPLVTMQRCNSCNHLTHLTHVTMQPCNHLTISPAAVGIHFTHLTQRAPALVHLSFKSFKLLSCNGGSHAIEFCVPRARWACRCLGIPGRVSSAKSGV